MDKSRVLNKLGEMDEYLANLKKRIPENFKEYDENLDKRLVCERLLEMSIESVLDVCGIIVSEKNLGLPQNEKDMIKKLYFSWNLHNYSFSTDKFFIKLL